MGWDSLSRGVFHCPAVSTEEAGAMTAPMGSLDMIRLAFLCCKGLDLALLAFPVCILVLVYEYVIESRERNHSS